MGLGFSAAAVVSGDIAGLLASTLKGLTAGYVASRGPILLDVPCCLSNLALRYGGKLSNKHACRKKDAVLEGKK